MIIEINTNTQVEIRDLGIILNAGETINLLDNFYKEDLLQSLDLESAINGEVDISIDGETVDYGEFIEKLSSFTKHEHNTLNKIQHNIYKDNYFMVTKQDGNTKYITYYTDDSMTNKIQEDEIVRDENGKVSQIISRKFENDSMTQEMKQSLNRNGNGKVESITTNII